MKFKIEENLPLEVAADLRNLGHDADTVLDEGLRGAKDPAVLDAGLAAGRILFTLDKGIANVRQYPLTRHAGVVLFRPAESGRRAVLAFVRERLLFLLSLDLQGKLTVASPSRIRFWQLVA